MIKLIEQPTQKTSAIFMPGIGALPRDQMTNVSLPGLLFLLATLMANPQREHGYTTIANETMEALAKFRIPGEARQMLDVIIRKTYGFNKKIDRISTTQFILVTGLSRGMVHRARKRLLYSNLITVCKNVDSQILSYSFQKDYEKWKVYAKKHTVCKKVSNCMQKSTQTVPNNEAHNRKKDNTTKDIHDVFDFFLLKTKKNYKLTPVRAKLIEDRLKTYTIDDIKKAIDNFVKDTWEGRADHMDLVYCIGIRNKIDNLEKWLNKAQQKKPYDPYKAREAIGRIESEDNRK